MSNKKPWVLLAPAKINLHLWVTGLLDDGRHTLDTSFAYVDVYDRLHIQTCDTLEVHCSNPALDGESNLVYHVLHALRQRYGIDAGLDVYIDKCIPDQAGLGGGSSDAATALLAACSLWRIPISLHELMAFATPWGADIPCFLFGQTSHATGIGEQLQCNPNPLPGGAVCLAKPASGLSTKAVFEHFDGYDALTIQTMLASVRAASLQGCFVGQNMLEPSACSLLPELKTLLRSLRKFSQTAWMTGSGSCCVALCQQQDEAKKLAEHVKADQHANWTIVGRLLDKHPLYHLIMKHAELNNNGA